MSGTRKGKPLTILTATVLVIVGATLVTNNWPDLVWQYRLWRDFESLGKNEQGYSEYRHRQTQIIFVSLPGGTFLMGSPEDEEGRRDNEQQHEVTLNPFLIAKYEVNQKEWWLGDTDYPRFFDNADGLPVVQGVSWNDCEHFCEKTGLRFPTEAQWEYACRGGKPGSYGGTGNLDEMGWYAENSSRMIHARGTKNANQFGLYDMHGNVSEWCEDVIDVNFYSKLEALRNHPVSGSRVARGGSFDTIAESCRSAIREAGQPSSREEGLGFRPAYPSP